MNHQARPGTIGPESGQWAEFSHFRASLRRVLCFLREYQGLITSLHPEILIGCREETNPGQTLGPIGSEISRNYQSYWKAIEHRQWLAVHEVGDHTFVDHSIREIERLEKQIGRKSIWPCSGFQSLELDLDRTFLYACAVEQFPQRNPSPHRVSHRAVAPLSAGNTRLQTAAAVSGTLVGRSDRNRLEVANQLPKAEGDRPFHVALDVESPGLEVNGV